MIKKELTRMFHQKKANRSSRGFTLIELLVTVGIIALLLAITIPVVSRARESSRTTRCMTNLHSIGQAVMAYISENHGFFPPMATMPTIDAANPASPKKSIFVLLGNYVSQENKVFRCPSDRFIDPSSVAENPGAAPPANVSTWHEWQSSSYGPMYGVTMQMSNGQWALSRENSLSPLIQQVSGPDNFNNVPLLFDYEQFHPVTDNSFASGRCILFADLHVDKGNNFAFTITGL
jgi:prepilin-type N-terminal cleavage/methylation domain-containing protein